MPTIQTTLARKLNLTAAQVAAVIDLVDDGDTIWVSGIDKDRDKISLTMVKGKA